MNTEIYRIGELARRAGKTVRTIHFYEELELLHPTARSKGGFRMYNDSALDRIHWIEKLQELGFSLTDIREFLLGYRSQSTGPESMDILRTFYIEKLSETQSAIERLLLEKRVLNGGSLGLRDSTFFDLRTGQPGLFSRIR